MMMVNRLSMIKPIIVNETVSNQADTPSTEITAAAPDNAPAANPPLAEGMICPDCAYDLRGSTSPRCPECGADLSVLHRNEPLIPWEHRDTLGIVRAFFSTVYGVFWRSETFCRAMATPVNHRAAETFRRLNAALCSLASAVLISVPFMAIDSPDHVERSVARWGFGSAWLLLTLCAYWLPGVFSHAFQSPRLTVLQRDRAVSISLYLWCAFLLLSISGVLIDIALLLEITRLEVGYYNLIGATLALFSVAFLIGAFIVIFNRLETFSRHMLREPLLTRIGRLVWYGVLGGATILWLIFFCLSLFYLDVIFESFR